jgi:hypothetical protein
MTHRYRIYKGGWQAVSSATKRLTTKRKQKQKQKQKNTNSTTGHLTCEIPTASVAPLPAYLAYPAYVFGGSGAHASLSPQLTKPSNGRWRQQFAVHTPTASRCTISSSSSLLPLPLPLPLPLAYVTCQEGCGFSKGTRVGVHGFSRNLSATRYLCFFFIIFFSVSLSLATGINRLQTVP